MPMNRPTKRCHWIPQSYMRQFSQDKARRKIWRLSKKNGEPELKRIDKVAVKFNLYSPKNANGVRDDTLEKKLSELEQHLGGPPWIALCNSVVDLTWGPVKKLLSLIVATTWIRNPSQFNLWKQQHYTFVDIFSEQYTLPSHIKIGDIECSIDPSDWPKFRSATEEDMKLAWNSYVTNAGDMAPDLLKMRMSMLVATTPSFITSDNPVAITHPSMEFKGIRDPKTKIIMPISPTRALVLDNQHNEPDGAYYKLSADEVTTINLQTWLNSLEYMLSPRNPIDVCEEFNELSSRH